MLTLIIQKFLPTKLQSYTHKHFIEKSNLFNTLFYHVADDMTFYREADDISLTFMAHSYCKPDISIWSDVLLLNDVLVERGQRGYCFPKFNNFCLGNNSFLDMLLGKCLLSDYISFPLCIETVSSNL